MDDRRILSCDLPVIIVYGRYTLVTGETALQAFRKHIHPAVGIFFIVALTAGVSGSVMGVMGIVADICFEWSKTMIDGGIAPIYFAIFFIALVYLHLLERQDPVLRTQPGGHRGDHGRLFPSELLHHDAAADRYSERPDSQPARSSGRPGKGPFLVIASMVGTTVFSGLFIIRTTLVKEAGWTVKDFKKQRNDAIVSVVMMFVISGSIMAAAAGTLYAEGLV